ncbi:MAG: HEAT repeat domain-containing protein [Planctomycetota bacterium]|jgi:HEAT repeat protein
MICRIIPRRIRLILALLVLSSRPLDGQDAVVDAELVWPPQDTLTPLLLYEEPLLPITEPVAGGYPGFLQLWTEALKSDVDGLKRDAAVSIVRMHSGGYLDCSPMAAALTGALQTAEANRLVLKDVARGLVTIDARQSADALFAVIGRDPDLVRIAEPALARWNHAAAQEEWLRRLANYHIESRQLVLSAIRGLGVTRNTAAAPLLKQIILRSPDSTCRNAAAGSLGSVQHSGLEELAEQLLREESRSLSPSSIARSLLHRRMAVDLLRNHSSDSARKTLLTLAADDDGAVATVAWESLLRSAPRELRAITESSATARDSRVRGLVVQTLTTTADEPAVAQLGRLLADRHHDVRNAARESLLFVSETDELHDAVKAAGVDALADDHWEGLEQAAILLGVLDHEPAADRCFELITHPRDEVAIAAAWTLRKLSVPATLPRMLKFCQEIDDKVVSTGQVGSSVPDVIAHLFEAMGQMKYEPADGLLRRYVPKKDPRLLFPARQAAINALGMLHQGSADSELSAEFYQRILDEGPFPIYEEEEVRYASVIAIGRIKADSFQRQLAALKTGPSLDPRTYAVEWALTQYSGEPLGRAVSRKRGLPLLPMNPLGSRLEAAGTSDALSDGDAP